MRDLHEQPTFTVGVPLDLILLVLVAVFSVSQKVEIEKTQKIADTLPMLSFTHNNPVEPFHLVLVIFK